MLEILALMRLTKTIGNIVEEKGRKSGGYKFLTVVLWFGFEIIGAVVGAVILEDVSIALYLFALIGAGFGALCAYLIVTKLRPISNEKT